MLNKRLNMVVEVICQRGCRYVNTILRDPAKQDSCQPLLDLNATEKDRVLSELRAVMAVYDQTGSCDV